MREKRLDLRGLNCPLPVLKARKAMRALAPGDVLVLECTDPVSAIDVPHFAAEDGHEMLAEEKAGSVWIFRIAKGG
ncbi:MAG: sulfurtransferase TusA family protein [Rhizobiaceae bacterium]